MTESNKPKLFGYGGAFGTERRGEQLSKDKFIVITSVMGGALAASVPLAALNGYLIYDNDVLTNEIANQVSKIQPSHCMDLNLFISENKLHALTGDELRDGTTLQKMLGKDNYTIITLVKDQDGKSSSIVKKIDLYSF